MRALPAAIIARFGDRRIRAPHLLEILVGRDAPASTGLHWTDAPFPITYGVDENDDPITYVQQWFDVGDIVIDDTGNQAMQLVFPDVGQIVRGLLFSESWSFRPATLRAIWLNDDKSLIEAYIMADGRADSGPCNFEDASEPVTISIVPDTDAEGAPGPAQEYQYNCRYVDKFKGLQCGYSGIFLTCDGTVTQCTARGNMERYGGFPFAPTPGSKITVGSGSNTLVETRNVAVDYSNPSRRRAVRH
jgi:hypothetical protein